MSDQNDVLSDRELEILQLVATGAANKEIARRLVISPNTVKVHLRNIFAKIGVSSRTEATLYAIQIGLIKPSGVIEAVEPTGDDDDEEEANASANTPVTAIGTPPARAETEQQLVYTTPVPIVETVDLPTHRPAWQYALLVLLAILLVTAGVFGSRLLSPAFPTATLSPLDSPSATAAALARWSSKAELPEPRKGMGIVEYSGGFYVIAGETAEGIDGALQKYAIAEDSWQVLESKPTPVTEVQAAVIGEMIYVPGGRLPAGESSDVLEVYDPRQGQWETRASLPKPLSGYGLAPFEGRLYLFGGRNGEQYSENVYEYDPQADEWQERTPLSEPRAFAAATVEGGRILLFGGYNGERTLDLNEAYYPTRDLEGEDPWETNEPMPEGSYGMGISNLAGVTFLLGGADDSATGSQPVKLQYIARSNEWAEFDAPPIEVGAHNGLIAYGNFLHILGGESEDGISSTHQAYQAMFTISIPVIRGEEEE